jgi:glycosyltransferase involved in cell wall biosynthesis
LGEGAGMMVPPADPMALAEAIGGLIQDPELRERQGDAGRKRVEQSYSKKEIVGELIARFQACAPVGSN